MSVSCPEGLWSVYGSCLEGATTQPGQTQPGQDTTQTDTTRTDTTDMEKVESLPLADLHFQISA